MTMTPRSSVRDVLWPAIVMDEEATLLALAFQLEQTQWWSAEELLAQQYRQLTASLRHARATVPFYQKRLADAGVGGEEALTPQASASHPPVDAAGHPAAPARPHQHPPALRPRPGPPQQDLRVHWTTPEVLNTTVDTLLWKGLTIRDHPGNQRDLSRATGGDPLGALRAGPAGVF